MQQVEFTPDTALAVVVAVGALTDAWNQRVPNWLTFPATVLALCFQYAIGGLEGLGAGFAGWAVGFGLLIGFYAKGGMGAGDVKLMAAIGAFAGPYRGLWIAIYTGVFGGIYALGIVVYCLVTRGGWAEAGKRLRAEGTSLVLTGGDVQPLSETLRGYPKLRYAIAMALGVATEAMVGVP